MAKPVRFSPKKSPNGWRLNVPPKFSETGKRQQLFYPTQKLALAAAEDLKKRVEIFGNQTRAIAPSLAEQAIAADALLKPLGIGLLEAVRRFVGAEELLRASMPIEDACRLFQATGASWSESQARAYRIACQKLAEAFGGRMISSIGGEELRRHLEESTGTASTYNHAFRLVRAFWRWSAKPPRRWCDGEAVAHLSVKSTVAPEIEVLTPDQCRAVMQAAEDHFPDCVVPFAIALFTGIRQQEIDRLQPHDITPEGITLPAASTKTKRRRFIEMPEPLAAWLTAHPISEHVTPPDWDRKQRAVRRMAGFKVWSNLVPKLDVEPPMTAAAPEDLPEWPTNGLRHTAASVALALGKPLEKLVFEHGHSGGLEMLRRHYIGTMTKKQALAIWAIRPHGAEAPERLEAVA